MNTFWLPLPGFLPDAVPFALRTTLSLLLAYAVSFVAQIEAASTAGICVAIIAQPSAGMAFSKARYRMLGTLCGGVAGLLLLGLFPQDRTALLLGYAAWLAICTFVGTLLRDFRSYAAVLSGYTAGVIAIAYIDAPASGLLAAADRGAAMLVGLLCVLLVNLVFAGTGAFKGLLAGLQAQAGAVAETVAGVLEGGPAPDDFTLLRTANAISAFGSQATFAGTELPDGTLRSNGARHTIEALLALLTTVRTLREAVGPGLPPAWRDHLRSVAAAVRGGPAPGLPPRAQDPVQALLFQAAEDVLALRKEALAGLHTLEHGGARLPRIRLRVSYDWLGAGLGACRAMIAIAFCAWFTVVAGWPGATLLLIQSTAIIALLGTAPNPTQASLPFLVVLPPVALAVGVLKFAILPLASGFMPFALTVGPLAFALALMVRHPVLLSYGPSALLFMTLLLSPSNPQTFDLSAYCNTVLELLLSTCVVLLTFRLILPVSPGRRLGRAAAEIGRNWRRGHGAADVAPPSLLYDRLSRVLLWLGPPTPSRRRLLGQLYATGVLDGEGRRAQRALSGLTPGLADGASAARQGLATDDPAAMLRAAQLLLDGGSGPAMRRAAASLAASALLLRRVPGLVRLGRLVSP